MGSLGIDLTKKPAAGMEGWLCNGATTASQNTGSESYILNALQCLSSLPRV